MKWSGDEVDREEGRGSGGGAEGSRNLASERIFSRKNGLTTDFSRKKTQLGLVAGLGWRVRLVEFW